MDTTRNIGAGLPAGAPAAAGAKAGPRDVFLHLLAVVTLYLAAVSFGGLLFSYIDRFFPDPLTDHPGVVSQGIRWAVSLLVIVFPVYLWLSWRLAREVTTHPEKRELRIRKWLLYFTLFAAAAIILGDLVALIYNFLGGDLTVRFILKVAAVLFIAAVVFGYYLWNLRMEAMASRDTRMRFLVFGAIAIVAVATIGGFFLIGSPFQERLRRFDERRVQHLQEIQWQVINYWQRKEKLPAVLDDLRDPISGFTPPTDPETGVSYEYRVVGPLSFELCGIFKTVTPSQTTETKAGRVLPGSPAFPDARGMETWSHQSGRVCFERAIDPELYPPFREPKR